MISLDLGLHSKSRDMIPPRSLQVLWMGLWRAAADLLMGLHFTFFSPSFIIKSWNDTQKSGFGWMSTSRPMWNILPWFPSQTEVGFSDGSRLQKTRRRRRRTDRKGHLRPFGNNSFKSHLHPLKLHFWKHHHRAYYFQQYEYRGMMHSSTPSPPFRAALRGHLFYTSVYNSLLFSSLSVRQRPPTTLHST